MKSGEQRRGSVLPPNTGYVRDLKIEILTMSTKWTFICNFENLSKVALWVSFEPYRSVSMCLLFSWCTIFSTSLTFHLISPNHDEIKTHLFPHCETTNTFIWVSHAFWFLFSLKLRFLCSRTIKALHQSWPFPTLRKQPLPLEADINGSSRKYSYHLPLREQNHKASSAQKNIKA